MKILLTILFAVALCLHSYGQQTINKIETIPYPLQSYNDPLEWKISNGQLSISAAGKTNLFNSPNGKSKIHNAPMILFTPAGDFTLSAKVTGELKAVYDVAALTVFQDENTWAKLCYEKSVLEEPTIVSVVTREFSDDCNSEPTGNSAYLSVIRKGAEFSFFYSQDGTHWKMVRHFHLEVNNNLKVGFAAHGSRGDGFIGIFSEIKYQDKAVDDMRELSM